MLFATTRQRYPTCFRAAVKFCPERETILTDTTTDIAKSLAASLTLRGALAMALAFVAGRLGYSIPDEQIKMFADAIVQIVFYGGLLAVGVGRARAKGPLS
jgi:hypothetical protein